jgi:predicted transglutaminase-like cysteine proteinase
VLGGWATASGATPLPPTPQPAAPGGIIEAGMTLSPRRPLLAHVRFCLLYEGQCDPRPDRRPAAMTAQDKLDEAGRINRAVNRAIRPQSDGRFDSWDIGVAAGDCEDYALQKRKELIALGWPTDRLRIAVGRTARGEPHAVLLVRIGGVDYVLDNLHDRVLPWDRTGHVFLMLQDRHDPRAWHTLAPRRGGVGTS